MEPIPVLVGLILAFLGLRIYNQQRALKRTCTASVVGEVVRVHRRERTETETDDDGREQEKTIVAYYPEFQYTVGDRTISQVATTGTGKPRFKEGHPVTIFYDPAKPDSYYVAEDKAESQLGIYLVIFGLVCIAFGVVLPLVNGG